MKVIDSNVNEIIMNRIYKEKYRNSVAKRWRINMETGIEEYSEILFTKKNGGGYIWINQESAPYIEFRNLEVKIPCIIDINSMELVDYLCYLACDMKINAEVD